MRDMRGKSGQLVGISWIGRSVSGLVVIAGLVIYLTGDKGNGEFLIIVGLLAAIAMSPIGRRLFFH